MRVWLTCLSVLLATAVLLSIPGGAAQDGDGRMLVETDMTVRGIDPLDGSGSLKITFDEAAAGNVRGRIFSVFDANADQLLSSMEVRAFLDAYCDALVGKTYWGITIRSTTDNANVTESSLGERTHGLLYTRPSAQDSLWFRVSFSGTGLGSAKLIQTAQSARDTFGIAVNETLGYDFSGTLVVSHKLITMGMGSYLNPQLESGKVDTVRIVVGVVLWYKFEGEVVPGEPVRETIRYETFSAFENQQVAFVLVLIGAYLVLRIPVRGFAKYKMLHARKYRKYAKPLDSVRVVSLALTVAMFVIYFFPTLFILGASGNMIYTSYLFMVIPACVIAQYFVTRALYEKAALRIPEESVIEVKQATQVPEEREGEILCKLCYRAIDEGLDLYQCGCGTNLHVGCAERTRACPSCGEMLFPERTRSIQCKACGESFLYSGAEDPYSVQCTKCGAFQEEVKAGKNYLVIDRDSRNAYMMIRAMALSGRPTLCITTEFPGKIRSEYELGDVDIKWFSDSSTDIDNLNPRDLDGDAMESVSTFLQTTKAAGLLVDGIERLIELNGFDKVLTFIKRINDLAVIHGSTVILALNRERLSEGEFKDLSDEFDEIHDYL